MKPPMTGEHLDVQNHWRVLMSVVPVALAAVPSATCCPGYRGFGLAMEQCDWIAVGKAARHCSGSAVKNCTSWTRPSLNVDPANSPIVVSRPLAHCADVKRFEPDVWTMPAVRSAIRTAVGFMCMIVAMVVLRQDAHPGSVVANSPTYRNPVTSATGHADCHSPTSLRPSAFATGSRAGSHIAACESPKRTSTRFELVSPNTHFVGT